MEASFMSGATSQTIYFYDRHPISCEIILKKLRESRGHIDGLRPEELLPHDQDHYGGVAATDELARGAQIGIGSHVADFCAGLGGMVRYLAHKYGADVTGIELTPARVTGAQELTRRVGLQATARIIEGNVMDVPLPDGSVDAVVSQEAFCHVPDVKRAVAEAFRILRTDGRLAFTDWIANQPLSAIDAQLMWEGMAIQPLRSIPEYCSLVEGVGLTVISSKDLTEEWGPVLKERLAMYQRLREEARQAGTPMGHDEFHRSYIRFVELIQERKLGGVRMVAAK
jgi:sarcosine/dimethylglycine N-methyltransferase